MCWHLRRAGIRGKSYTYLRQLTDRQHAILLGTLLGDGCLKQFNERCNAQLTLGHCAAQAGYLRWKVAELAPLFKTEPHWYTTKDGHQSLCAASRSHPLLTEYRDLFYGLGKKAIGPAVLDAVTKSIHLDLLVAVWYMDDGSMQDNAVRLTLGGLDDEQYVGIQGWFAGRGMPGSLYKLKGTNCVVLRLGVGSSRILFDMVRPHIHPDLRYKLPEWRSKVVREGGRS